MIDPFTIAMIGSAVIGAAGTAGGGLLANQGREDAANSAIAQNWKQMEAQRMWALDDRQWQERNLANQYAWQEMMAGSAYRRAMADMRAAGLNPMLAYSQGGARYGAAGGAGSTNAVSGFSAPVAQVENVLGPAVSSAMQAAQAVQGIQSAQATIDQTQANTALLREETVLRQDQQAQARASTALATAQAVTEGHRAGLVSDQRATEQMNPALRAAQTAAQNASAVEAGARTEGHNLENTRMRNYGPRSSAADAAANAEAVARRAAGLGASMDFRGALDHVSRALGGQSGYSGPRSLPALPRSVPRDDPYGLMSR